MLPLLREYENRGLMEHFFTWCRNNNLKLNISKTHWLVVCYCCVYLCASLLRETKIKCISLYAFTWLARKAGCRRPRSSFTTVGQLRVVPCWDFEELILNWLTSVALLIRLACLYLQRN